MPETLHISEEIIAFGNENQREVARLINELGGASAAARQLGVNVSSVTRVIARLKKRAVVQGYSPEHNMTKAVPEPFVARGHSTLYGRDGEVKLQWVKSRLDDDKYQELLAAAAEAMAEELPRVPSTPLPHLKESAAQLANLYVMTDAHLGAFAWKEEGGANWDLKIAERTLNDCFMAMMQRSPEAHLGVIGQLGDWMHWDGLIPVTTASGHVLDGDGRFGKVVRVAIRLLRRMVSAALLKHEKVIVLMAEGNHDPAASVWLQSMFAAIYEDEPRVEVVQTPLPYYAVQHGSTALFFHHGHKKKIGDLPMLFAAQFGRMWGDTTKRYIHTGHLHHLEEKEHAGVKVTQHPTLAARDGYASRGGWISERQASAITYHSEHGQVGSVIVTPEMVASREHAIE